MNKDVPATERFVRENLLRFFGILNWKIFVVHDELQSISGERFDKVAKGFKTVFTGILEGGSVRVLAERCNTDRARSSNHICNTVKKSQTNATNATVLVVVTISATHLKTHSG